MTVHLHPSGHANGLTLDGEGRLLVCEHGNRRLSRIETDGRWTVLAERYRGTRFNCPNDVIVKSDGAIYFTDPPYGIAPTEQDLPFQGVFRYAPESGEVQLLVDDFERPNGLAFSPDEQRLYIADSHRRHIRVFVVDPDGGLHDDRVFTEIRSELPGSPDGMKVDAVGQLYVAAAGGIWVFAPDGERRDVIKTPETPSNCAWGDPDWKGLYITARTSLYRIAWTTPGVPTPATSAATVRRVVEEKGY